MIFLTVGTEYPLDRLVRTVDKLAGQGKLFDTVYAQIGLSQYRPEHMEWTELMDRTEFDRKIQEASAVIAHAGMGTIIRCLELRKPLLVLARLPEYGEMVSDHQVGTSRKFSERGDILVARDENELPSLIPSLETFIPPERTNENERLISHIAAYLSGLEGHRT